MVGTVAGTHLGGYALRAVTGLTPGHVNVYDVGQAVASSDEERLWTLTSEMVAIDRPTLD